MNYDTILNSIKSNRFKFIKSYKCIYRKKPLKFTRNRHVKALITCYNQIVEYYSKLTFNHKEKVRKLIAKIKQKLKQIFDQFELKITTPTEIEVIKIYETDLEQEDKNISLIEELDSLEKEKETEETEEDRFCLETDSASDLEGDFDMEENKILLIVKNKIMAQTVVEFIKLATSLIPEFDGRQENLQSFLDSLNLLDTLKGTREQTAIAL